MPPGMRVCHRGDTQAGAQHKHRNQDEQGGPRTAWRGEELLVALGHPLRTVLRVSGA